MFRKIFSIFKLDSLVKIPEPEFEKKMAKNLNLRTFKEEYHQDPETKKMVDRNLESFAKELFDTINFYSKGLAIICLICITLISIIFYLMGPFIRILGSFNRSDDYV